MKFTWEPKDIWCGRRVGLVNGAKEQWIIGYNPASDKKHQKYWMISLSDGMVLEGKSAADMAKSLTDGYKPLSLEERS